MTTNTENLRLTTGRLYWQPQNESGYFDLGNCTSSRKYPAPPTRAKHYAHAEGVRRVDMTAVETLDPTRVFTFDEHLVAALRLQHMSLPTETATSGASGATYTITSGNLVLGRTYFIGKQAITAISAVTAGATPLVRNVDYVLDEGAGAIRILSSANFGSNWIFTYSATGPATLDFAAFSRLLEQGSFVFVEKDQADTVPLNREAFTGQVCVTGWGESGSEKFQEYTVEVIEIS